MNEEFKKIDDDYKKCLSFEDSTAKIKRIDELIEDTNSSREHENCIDAENQENFCN